MEQRWRKPCLRKAQAPFMSTGQVALAERKPSSPRARNVVMTAKYEGDFPIKVKVQKMPGDEVKQCFVIIDGVVKETFVFDAVGDGEAASLADTLQSSAYVTMEGGKTGEVAEFEQALTGGSNPSVTGDGYVEGFYALEPYYYNVICCDTIAEGVQNLLHEYIDEVVKVGKFPDRRCLRGYDCCFQREKDKGRRLQ